MYLSDCMFDSILSASVETLEISCAEAAGVLALRAGDTKAEDVSLELNFP